MSDNVKKLQDDFIKLNETRTLFHSYLFFGSIQPDIFDFARSLANFLESNFFEKPVRLLNDFLAIQPNEDGNIGIDEIRALQNFVYQRPVISKKRTAVIYQADNLTNEAQSSLLKILEEPPSDALIILIANQEDALLPTIVSRMHKIYFALPRNNTKPEHKITRNKKTGEEDIEKEIEALMVDLSKNLSDNFKKAKEVLKRLALVKQYNLNKPLQLRHIKNIVKKKQ